MSSLWNVDDSLATLGRAVDEAPGLVPTQGTWDRSGHRGFGRRQEMPGGASGAKLALQFVLSELGEVTRPLDRSSFLRSQINR